MAALTLAPLTPYLTMAGLGWLYYRRLRRHFGRQRWQPRRTWLRVGLLCGVGLLLVALALRLPPLRLPMAVGALAGIALGVFALRHTRVEMSVDGASYTPNPWIGGGLSLLLIARLVWRWQQGAFSSGLFSQTHQVSPLTLGIAAVLVAYSLTQGIGLIRRMRALGR